MDKIPKDGYRLFLASGDSLNCILAAMICTLLLIIISACGSDSATSPASVAVTDPVEDPLNGEMGAENPDSITDEDTSGNSPAAEGTIAQSRGALTSFLKQEDFADTANEFWLCEFSDNSTDSYLMLNSTDDIEDPGFDPYVLLGKTRDAVLDGDPRSIAPDSADPEPFTVTFFMTTVVTSTDTVLVEVRQSGYAGAPDIAWDFLNVRLGPGRVFTADSTLDNNRVTCTATNIGSRVLF